MQDVAIFLKDKLVEAFENPKETIKAFGQLMVDQIINRFKAIGLGIQAVGRAFRALKNFDMEEAKQAGIDMGIAWAQALTGTEDVIGKIGSAINVVTGAIEKGIETGNRLAEITIEIEKTSGSANSSLLESDEYEEMKSAAGDVLKTEEEIGSYCQS